MFINLHTTEVGIAMDRIEADLDVVGVVLHDVLAYHSRAGTTLSHRREGVERLAIDGHAESSRGAGCTTVCTQQVSGCTATTTELGEVELHLIRALRHIEAIALDTRAL